MPSIDPLEGIMDGLAAGMQVVGDLYEKNEYFVSGNVHVR